MPKVRKYVLYNVDSFLFPFVCITLQLIIYSGLIFTLIFFPYL